MYNLNDKVIYPGHGVAQVEELTEKMVGGHNVVFIKLVFLFKDMTIWVPTYNIISIGIRPPSSLDVVNASLAELFKQPEKRLESIDFTPSGWNKRYKDYQAKIQGGNLLEISKIYRDLMYIAQKKDLSFGERSLVQTTEELIAQEIQIVKKIERELVIQEIRNPFKQLAFHEAVLSHKQLLSEA